MKQYIFKFIKQRRTLIIIIAAFSPVYLLVGCPLRFLTGFCCPGCGMSRAVLSLVCFDLEASLHYHPLVLILPIAAAVYFLRRRIPKKLMIILCVAALLLFLAVYIIRLTGDSTVVYCDLSRGALYRLFHKT